MAKSDGLATKKYVTLALAKTEDKLLGEIRRMEKKFDRRIDFLEYEFKVLHSQMNIFMNDMICKFDNLSNKLDEILEIIKINNKNRKDRIQKLEKVAIAV